MYIYTLSRECTTRLYHAKSFGLFAKPVPTVNGFKVPIALDVCQSNEKNYPPTSSATKELHVPFQGGDRGRWWEPQTSVHSLHVYVPPCWRIHTLSRECTTRLYHAKSFGLFAKPVPTVNGFKVPIALDVCQSNEKNYPPTSSATKELHVPFHASLPGLQRKKVCWARCSIGREVLGIWRVPSSCSDSSRYIRAVDTLAHLPVCISSSKDMPLR